jgi:hypothetical protein
VTPGATLGRVPTTRRRHAITETPPVQEALDELRDALGSDRVPMGDVVIRGAREMATELREQKSDKARRLNRLADRICNREGFGMSLEAAEEVRRTGWARPL